MYIGAFINILLPFARMFLFFRDKRHTMLRTNIRSFPCSIEKGIDALNIYPFLLFFDIIIKMAVRRES